MSIKILREAMQLDDEVDGLQEKRKRTKRKTPLELERELLKQSTDYDFDFDSGDVVKKKKQNHKSTDVASALSNKIAKQGYSLVDQYRDIRPQAGEIRESNEEYLNFTDRTQLSTATINSLTKKLREAKAEKKAKMEDRNDARNVLTQYKQKQKKNESTSIFSDADFAVVNQKKVLDTGCKRIK